ncbi:MAG: hypothetical protein Q6363_006700 [Candidatus Njordarchaeota archaeon]
MTRKSYVSLLLLTFFLLLYSDIAVHSNTPNINNIVSETTNSYKIRGDIPIIFVYKKSEKPEVNIGEWFEISIIIANFGNTTAYDLVIQDENYPEWTIETQNHSTKYYVPLLDPNVTIYIRYRIRIIHSSQKNVSLGKTTIAYRDSYNNSYTSISKELFVIVKLRTIYVDTEKIQEIMLEGTAIITVLPLIGLIIIERKTLKEYMSRSKKKK